MKRWQIWTAAAIAAGLCALLLWPGELVGNSLVQLKQIEQGHLTDWHPPLMARIWQLFGLRSEGLFLLNLAIYWLGIGLVADELWKQRPKWALAIIAIGATPISLHYLAFIQRDNFMVSFLLLGAGLGLKVKGGGWAALPAILFRTDAAIAFAPLAIRSRRATHQLAIWVLLIVALFPVTNFVNRQVLGSSNGHALKSLQLFDLAGIQANSGAVLLPPDLARCYTPFWWDALELHCRAQSRTPDDLTGRWFKAIAAHPIAYAEHRLRFYNHETFFLVPARQECVAAPLDHECGSLLDDAIKRNLLFWPCIWLAIGAAMLCVRLEPFPLTLVWSAMLFAFAHLFVGVASAFRYFYWTEVAIQIALIWQIAVAGLPRWRFIAAAAALVAIGGLASRYFIG